MAYVVDYCIISIVFLIITIFFYYYQKRLPSSSNYFFNSLLLICLSFLFFDVLTGSLVGVIEVPKSVEYILNIIYLSCAQLNGPVFLFYSFVITGRFRKLSHIKKWLWTIPFFIAITLIMISPLTKYGVFYFDDLNNYFSGKSHLVLYVVIGIYLLASLIDVTKNAKKIGIKKVLAIYLFILLMGLTMLCQMFYGKILVNSMGNALALIIIYHTLQLPENHNDSLTGLLNNKCFSIITKELIDENIDFSVLVFTLKSFHLINQNYGIKIGDEVMVRFAQYLNKNFPKKYIIRSNGNVYTVINSQENNILNQDSLNNLKEIIPSSFKIDNQLITLDIAVLGYNSHDFENKEYISNIYNYFIQRYVDDEIEDFVFVDEKMRKSLDNYQKTEVALSKAVNNNNVQVYYQPIHDASGNLVALEALCRIFDDELGYLRPDIFIEIAEKNGLIHKLGAIVLDKVCAFIEKNNVSQWKLHHIGVNLSFLECTRLDLYSKIMSIINKYNIPKSLISFEITETEYTQSIPTVVKNMELLKKEGFKFLLDDFGTGYANYDYIAQMSFNCIKIDKIILWQAMTNNKDMGYLVSLAKAFKKLELATVCEGVETLDQVKVLDEMGIDMKQGYYYSKALSPVEICSYYQSTKNRGY